MELFDVLGEPVRRRVLEHLASGGELSAGALVGLVGEEFGISQPAVSQHLRVLREAGLVEARPDGSRRIYALRAEQLVAAEAWLAGLRQFWAQRLDSLETELARGRRERRTAEQHDIPEEAAGRRAGTTTRRMA